MLLLAAAAVLALVGAARAQCDLQQHVAGGVHYIVSPNYPLNYTAGTQCRWCITADPGAQLKLSCGVFKLPASTNCTGDRVRISLSGDDSLNDAHVYCGQRTFTLLSDANKLTMVLETLYTSTGGLFLCNMRLYR
ncbi:hypothetical protein R5R35_001480 [Gryllus longicercus]|uniref:CUB domain-containing protein n=1 Tax=Gryllus longicercus TaxID=2509291 RepID=A0AAN9VGC4_9ORTH